MSSRVIKITLTQVDLASGGSTAKEEEVLVEGVIVATAEGEPLADDDIDLWRCMVGLCDCADHADHLI